MAAREPQIGPTVKPPPPPDPDAAPIETALELTALAELGPHVFTNARPLWQPLGARGIYGGGVIAQSLLAATRTLPPGAGFAVHSLHCYFLLAGDPAVPAVYHVDVVRQGRSFLTRAVQARQRGQTIATLTCSFTRTKPADRDAQPSGDDARPLAQQPVLDMPAIRPPDECESGEAALARLLAAGQMDAEQVATSRERLAADPFEWRSVGTAPARGHGDAVADAPPAHRVARHWVRSKRPIRDVSLHAAVLAYISDMDFVGTAFRVNPSVRRDRFGMMVSLDHAVHFHAPAAPLRPLDDWLLLEASCPWAAAERVLVRMRIWTTAGTLIASCQQEGILRPSDGRRRAVDSAPAAAAPPAKL